MSESSNARRTMLSLDYNNQNITSELEKHLLDWTYTDNLSGEIDDLSINLKDTDAFWTGKWFPTKGALLVPTIIRTHWIDQEIKTKLGKFELDELTGSAMPSIITIKALATTELASLRGEEKSKAWEKVPLKTVISELASKNGLKFVWESSENPKKDRYEQDGETDLAFIYRLCKEEGLCLKITNISIVVLDEADYEQKGSVSTIRRVPKDKDTIKVISHSFKSTLSGVYRACRVTHHDSAKKKNITATFVAPNAPKTGRTLVVKEEVKTKAEAEKLAKKKLRETNKNANTMTLEVFTAKHIDAGMTFDLEDFGKLSGKYIATQAVYKPFGITLQLRRCLEGY